MPQNAALDEFESVEGLSGTQVQRHPARAPNDDRRRPRCRSPQGGIDRLSRQRARRAGHRPHRRPAGRCSEQASPPSPPATSSSAATAATSSGPCRRRHHRRRQVAERADRRLAAGHDPATGDTDPRLHQQHDRRLTAGSVRGHAQSRPAWHRTYDRRHRDQSTPGDIDTAQYQGLRSEYAFSATADGQLIVTACDRGPARWIGPAAQHRAARNFATAMRSTSSSARRSMTTAWPRKARLGQPSGPQRHGRGRPDTGSCAATMSLNGGAGNDILVGGPSAATSVATFADNFDKRLHNNNHTGDTCIGPRTGWRPTTPAAQQRGQIRIDDGNNTLRFYGGTLTANFNGAATSQRTVNLAGSPTATISYIPSKRDDLDAGEAVTVLFAADGTNFGQSEPRSHGDPAARPTTLVALTGPFAANAAIRFVATAINAAGESVAIDNLSSSSPIRPSTAARRPSTAALGDDTYSFCPRRRQRHHQRRRSTRTSGGSGGSYSILAPTTGSIRSPTSRS